MLVPGLKSRRSAIFNLFDKKQTNVNYVVRAPSVGRHSPARFDEGGKSRTLLAMKALGTSRNGGGREKPAI